MHVILGGTGHVGSAAARALLAQGEKITIVTHDPAKKASWQTTGASVAIADVHDVDALRRIFRTGKRAFLLNPPADPRTDTDAQERKTVAAIVAALEGSGLEKVVAESAFGARPGERCGDLSVLHGLEEALKRQSIPASVIRAAYYFSNWDMAFETARDQGIVNTMFPADFKMPMVAPEDLGRTAARLLTEPADRTGIHYVEGPRRYSPADVAAAFSAYFGKPVKAVATPRERWKEAFKSMGFSDAAADSYARMTAATADDRFETPSTPLRGQTTLEQYVAERGRQLSARS